MFDVCEAHLIRDNVAEFIQNRLQGWVVHEVEWTLKWTGGESKTDQASPHKELISAWT